MRDLGFYGGEDKIRLFLDCWAVYILYGGWLPTHRRTMPPPSSGWRWKQHGPPKRWYPATILHGAAKKTTNFINSSCSMKELPQARWCCGNPLQNLLLFGRYPPLISTGLLTTLTDPFHDFPQSPFECGIVTSRGPYIPLLAMTTHHSW